MGYIDRYACNRLHSDSNAIHSEWKEQVREIGKTISSVRVRKRLGKSLTEPNQTKRGAKNDIEKIV